MQATPDVFLGWTRNPVNGRRFCVRRLKELRLANIVAMLEGALPHHAKLCGQHPGRPCAQLNLGVML
jgi:hypothetical protein